MPTQIVLNITDPVNLDAWGLHPIPGGLWVAGNWPKGTVCSYLNSIWLADVQTNDTPGASGEWIQIVDGPGTGEDFGEIHVGVPSGSDDAGIIQAALDAAAAVGGGRVILGPYSYRSNSTITVPNKVYLEGAGLACDVYQLPFDYTNKEFAIYANVTGTTPAVKLNGGMKNVTILQDRVRTLGNPTTREQNATYVSGFTGYGVNIGDGTNPGPSNNTDMENVIIGGFARGINTNYSAQDRKKHIFIDCTNGYFLKDSHDDDKNDHIECWEFLTTNRAGASATWDIVSIADNGNGLWRLTTATQDLVTGEIINIRTANQGGEGITGRWTATVINTTTVDLQGSAVSVANSGTTISGNTYVAVASKTNLRRGMAISGTGIATGTLIAGVWADRNAISMTIAATASGTNTLTYTSNAYTASSMDMVYNGNYRSGEGFHIENTEGAVFNEAFPFAYENSFNLVNAVGISAVNSHADGGHNIGSITGAAIRFGVGCYNNYMQFGLLNGGHHGVVTSATGIAAGFANTVVSNRILADGVIAQAGMGDLMLVGVGANDNASPLLQDAGYTLTLAATNLPSAIVYGTVEPAAWIGEARLSAGAYHSAKNASQLVLKHPANPFFELNVPTAPVDERRFQYLMTTAGDVVARGLNDAGSVPLNYFAFRRPAGVTNGQIEFLQPLVSVGTAPTGSATGAGTSPVVTFGGGSNANAGVIVLTTGTGAPAALGTLTLTFPFAFPGGFPVVKIWPQDTGTAWNARASAWMSTQSTSAPVFKWDNNGVALAASTAYHFGYLCLGK